MREYERNRAVGYVVITVGTVDICTMFLYLCLCTGSCQGQMGQHCVINHQIWSLSISVYNRWITHLYTYYKDFP